MSLKSFFANLLRKDSYTDWVALGKELMPTQKTLDTFQEEFQDFKYMQLRQICRNTTSIINARIVLKETIFKNRFEWLPKFASKCTNPECGMEYDKHVDICEKCDMPTCEADVEQQTKADKFFLSVNEYDQSLIELLQDAEDEVNITDHGWLWLQKEYEFLPFDGGDKLKLIDSKINAIEKIFPEFIHHNLNKERRHNDEWFCIEHRNEIHDKPGFCKKCGKELLKAWYVYKDKKNTVYYAKSEMIWWTFYDSKGYSPVYAILKNVLTEWGMDDELYERYWNKTLPKALLAVTTSNIESLRKERDYIIEKAKKNETPFIGIESQTGRGDIKKISLMDDSVTDLTNEPTRDLIRKVVNTVYGVVPLYAADTEHASALSGEGQQLMVQEDRAKAKQAIYNEMILPQLLKELKVTDWTLQLKPPMEESEQRKLDIEAKKITNARGMFDMGFDVELDDDGNFVYSGEAKQPEVTMPSPFAKSAEKDNELERLAELEHKQWIAWSKNIAETENISKERLERWKKLWIPYLELTEEQKDQDRDWALKAIQKEMQKSEEDDIISKEDTLLIKARWEEVMEAIREGALWEDYEGLNKRETAQLNKILEREFAQPYISLNRITEKITKELGLTKARARLIGRTEMSAVLNKAREMDYIERDPENEFKYKALNPIDNRTTDCCERIVKRTAQGVSMPELKKIWKEESERFARETKSDFKYKREFVAHFGCRTSYVRSI